MLILIEDNKDKEPIVVYDGEIVPHIGETVYFPHKGAFNVVEVTYGISDDHNARDPHESMQWANVSVEKIVGDNKKNPTVDLDTSTKYMEGYQAGYKAAAQATIDAFRGAKE